jgi:DNA repair protein RadC
MSSTNGFYVRETFLPIGSDISPKKRADQVGLENLKDGELLMLALNIQEDKSRCIMGLCSLPELPSFPADRLEKIIGSLKARQLLSSFELARRAFQKGLGIQPAISSPADTLPFLTAIKDQQKEHFVCLYLNARNQLISQEVISIGSLSASIVHPREVFAVAISQSCASVLLAHNHPSADVSPSEEDIELTRRLVKAGEILGIEVIDHIIVGRDDFLSMKEKGLL